MPHNDINKATNQGYCQCMDNLGSPMTTTHVGNFIFYNEFGNRNQLNQPK